MTLTDRHLDFLFGPGQGVDPVERARASKLLYVRGLDLLTKDLSPKATGRRITATEALDTYGLDALRRVAEEGSAVISHSIQAAGRTLRARREQLGVSVKNVASASGLNAGVVEALESSRRRPIQEYERVARTLALDEGALSFRAAPVGNERIAVRLRTMADERTSLSSFSVVALAEATWVAATQLDLEQRLGLRPDILAIAKSSDFGGQWRAPYSVGYELADQFREFLGMGSTPIPSMRELAEDVLGVPVVLTTMNPTVGGATVEILGARAIILNTAGPNSNPMVRRSTVAHELCHLLYDPSADLDDLRVDEYADLERRPDKPADRVEQRANAFAIQLLAPQSESVGRYEESHDLSAAVLDYFGVSFTAGRYQVWNGLNRQVGLSAIADTPQPPEADWDGRESFTTSYHPIGELLSHPSRAGRFSALVVRAAQVGLISWDTAGQWLWASPNAVESVQGYMQELYPRVFTQS